MQADRELQNSSCIDEHVFWNALMSRSADGASTAVAALERDGVVGRAEFEAQARGGGIVVGCSCDQQRVSFLVAQHLTFIQDLDPLLASLPDTCVVLVAIQDAQLLAYTALISIAASQVLVLDEAGICMAFMR